MSATRCPLGLTASVCAASGSRSRPISRRSGPKTRSCVRPSASRNRPSAVHASSVGGSPAEAARSAAGRSTSTRWMPPRRSAKASRCGSSTGTHAGATGAAFAASRRSPRPSPPTTRSCEPEKYAIRVSFVPGDHRASRTAPGRASDQCTLPPGSSATSSCVVVPATKRPCGDHVSARYRESRRFEPSACTIHGPALDSTIRRPGEGRENSAGAACFSPTSWFAIEPSTARPGGVANAAAAAASTTASTSAGRTR